MIRLIFLVSLIGCVSGLSSFWYRLYGCQPPRTLKARAELIGYHNDRNDDGMTNIDDFQIDQIAYDYDGDVSTIKEWELVFHWRCVYGWDEEFGRYFFNNADRIKDGILTNEDLVGIPSFTGESFRKRQISRFREFCTQRNNKPEDCWRLEAEQNLNTFGNYSLPSLSQNI